MLAVMTMMLSVLRSQHTRARRTIRARAGMGNESRALSPYRKMRYGDTRWVQPPYCHCAAAVGAVLQHGDQFLPPGRQGYRHFRRDLLVTPLAKRAITEERIDHAARKPALPGIPRRIRARPRRGITGPGRTRQRLSGMPGT